MHIFRSYGLGSAFLILVILVIILIIKLLQRIGIFLYTEMTKSEVADVIEAFISGSGEEWWAWDDFTSAKFKDPELEKIREECVNLPNKYPPTEKGQYRSSEGIEVLRNIVIKLRTP